MITLANAPKIDIFEIEATDLTSWYVKLPTGLHTTTVYLEGAFETFRVILKFRSFSSVTVYAEIVTGDGLNRRTLMKCKFVEYTQEQMVAHIVGWFNHFYGRGQ